MGPPLNVAICFHKYNWRGEEKKELKEQSKPALCIDLSLTFKVRKGPSSPERALGMASGPEHRTFLL